MTVEHNNETPAKRTSIVDFLNAAESYTIDDILADLGEFHKADRAYIFRISREKGIAYNTNEWCAPGVEPQIEYLQALPLDEIQSVEDAVKKGELVIKDVDGELDHEDALYQILAPQDIHSIILAPLNIDGEFAGYIGVDNPQANYEMNFLQTVTSVVLSAKLESDEDNRAVAESQILLKKLCAQYTTLFYVNLATDYIHVYEASAGYGSKYAASRSYAAAMGEYVEHDIAEADRGRMRQATAASAIIERFKTEEAFEELFDDVISGQVRHCKLHFIKANDEGTCAVVCGSDVTARTEAEKGYKAELESQLSVINALARGFMNVYLVDLDDGHAEVVKLNGYVTSGLNKENQKPFEYPAILKQYISERVHPEDKEMLYGKISLEALRRVFATQDEYVGNYRALVDGESHYYQYNYVRPSEDSHFVVAGFQNVDDIVAEQAAQDAAHRKELEGQLAIINALARNYKNAYSVDLTDATAKVIKLDDDFVDGRLDDVMDQTFPYEGFLNAWIADAVHPDDRKMLADALSVAHLREVFADRNEYTGSYRMLADGKVHNYQFSVNAAGDGDHVVAGFQNVDDIVAEQVAQETAHRKELEGQLAIIDTLSKSFKNAFVANLNKGTARVLRLTDGYDVDAVLSVKDTVFPFDAVIQQWVTEHVHPDDKAKVAHDLSYENLCEVFTKQDEYVGTYRSFEGGALHHYQFDFRKVNDEGDVVAGFQIIDDIVAEQAAHQKELEEQFNLINALSSDFMTIYLANLEDGSATAIRVADDYGFKEMRDLVGTSFPFDAAMQQWGERFAHPDDKDRVLRAINLENMRKEFAQKDELVGNYRSCESGEYRNYQFDIKKVDESHVVAGFRNIDGIIAEQVEHQKELEEQFDIIRALASSFVNVYVANLEDGETRVVKLADDYNVRAVRDVEDRTFSFDAVVSRWVRENVHTDDKKRMQEILNMANLRKALAQQKELTGTYRSINDGVTHTYQYEIRRIGNTNSIVAGFTIIDDIIAEHEALEHEQREHAEVIQSISTIYSTIFRADTDTHEYEILNSVPLMAETAASTGNFDDVKEQIIENFMEPEFHKEMRAFLDLDTLPERLATTNTVTTDYKSTANQWMQARFIAKRRDEDGTAKEILYVARDITEEKMRDLEQQEALAHALAAAQQANKAKSTFLNSMSHDIRTPMNAIIGFTALAQTHMDNQEQVQDYLGKISTSSTHLLSLINDILDMSRIESGTVKLDESPLHIPDLLHDLRTMIQGLINSKNQNLFIDTQDVVHEDVIADKLRLNQVLINIVGNAMKYTQPGGDIIIRLVEKPCSVKGRTTFEFSVKDNGIGMSPEFVERIFDSFSREYSSTVSGIQGTGLGMAITKNIVDMMGGDIKVESEEGKGSKFTVTLNLLLADSQVKNEPIPDLLGARALVVDDDLNTCQSVSKMLREIQMRPDWTASGKEAVVRAQEAAEMGDEYKVYIIDYLMPDMNGIETVRRIRRVISEDVPIIVLTAYDWADFEAEAREAGVTAFVSKPIFMSELRAVLTRPSDGADADADAAQVHRDYSGKHILLVEDNELNREIAEAILGETGMTIDTVDDGDVAVETVEEAPAGTYDLVLMDVQMPRMDGYTATREIRTLPDNDKANIPIVAMTANAFDEDRKKAMESGMDDHIIKPISIEAIAKVLDRVFARTSAK